MPLRLTILHFEQRFLIDAVTFILISPYYPGRNAPRGLLSQSCNYTCSYIIRPAHYTAVRINGPFSVIATLCSKCALSEPSAEATVHWSGKTRV